VELARAWGRPARAAVTDMSQPLGAAIGNALEIGECVALLKGEKVKGRLRELSIAFAAEALVVLEATDREAARTQVREKLDSGAAAEAFARMVEAQGGDPRVVEDPWAVLPRAPVRREVTSEGGYLAAVDTERLGRAAAALGAGRKKKGDPIDPAVGIEFFPKIGDQWESGRPLALIHAQEDEAADAAQARVRTAVVLSPEPVEAPPLVHGWHGAADLASMAASDDAKGGPG
jgi:thymidine phosphorylase